MSYDWTKNWIDLYAVLGISRNATEDEIKAAYRQKQKENHPDGHVNDSKEEQEEAEERFKLVGYAYHVLCTDKENYDTVYDAKLNGTYNDKNSTQNNPNEDFTDDADYDETMKNYSEAEKRESERLSIKKIIEEEIEIANEYLKQKNQFLLKSYEIGIDKESYFKKVIELQELVYAQIANLEELQLIAYDYDLINYISLIDDVIKKLNKEYSKLPMNMDEIIIYVSKESVKRHIIKDLPNLTSECDNLLNDALHLAISCQNKTIIPLYFENNKRMLQINMQDKIDYLEKLIAYCTELELQEQVEALSTILARLQTRMKILPTTYDEACRQGRYIDLKTKIDKLNSLTAKINYNIAEIQNNSISCDCEALYEETNKLITEVSKLFEELEETHNLRGATEFELEIIVLKEEAQNLFYKSTSLYEAMTKYYSDGIERFKNNSEENILPTSILYEAIKKEIQIKEITDLYNFLRELHIEVPENIDIESYKEELEKAISLARKQRVTNNSYTTNNSSNGSNTNNKNNWSQGNNKANSQNNSTMQSNPIQDDDLEEEFEELLNNGNISSLWYDACEPSMWESATWEDFFTGDRAQILFCSSICLPKYIRKMKYLFSSIKSLQDNIQVGNDSEKHFLGELTLIDFLALEYEKELMIKYGANFSTSDKPLYKDGKTRSKNFSTPFILASSKLLRLWLQKSKEIILSQIQSFANMGIVTQQYSVFIDYMQKIINNKIGYDEVKKALKSNPSIYISNSNSYQEFIKIINRYGDNIRSVYGGANITARKQYKEDLLNDIIDNCDESFEELESHSTLGLYIPIFERYLPLLDQAFGFIGISKKQISSMKLSILIQFMWQQILNKVKHKDFENDSDEQRRTLKL